MFSDPFDSSSIFYENPSSNNSFFMTLPTSLLDDEELLFEHFHQSPHSTINIPPYETMNNNNNSPNTNSIDIDKFDHTQKDGEGRAKRKRAVGPAKKKPPAGGGTGRRRPGKKDRHSKIYTAQGPRDRRMRLSLQIARKFFDLQDMLGFDKASKTIEWLFSKSKSAIRDLTATLPPHQRKGSLMPSCVASSSSTSVSNEVNLEGLGGVKDSKPTRNTKLSSSRDAREKARARARQRTLEKNKQKELTLETNPSKFGSSSTPETVDQEVSGNQDQNQMSSVSIIEKLLGSDSSASSSSIYNECSYLNFAGNWGTDSLNMFPSYGATSCVDELQVILQQQKPKSVSPAGSSGYQGRNLL